MDNQKSETFPSVSTKLKAAIEAEQKKPHFACTEQDPCLLLWVAISVKQNHPESYDLKNPVDAFIWTLAETSI
jgi:hypothetical protein